MSKLIMIDIKNFKGIEKIKLNLQGGKSPGRFITLVGLNESGKTSLIEALSLSVLQDPDTADLLEATNTATDMADVVPKHRSAEFSDSFDITVYIDFSDANDVLNNFNKILKNTGFKLSSIINPLISITKSYKFSDGNYVDYLVNWSFNPQVTKLNGNKQYYLYKISKSTWLTCIGELKKLLPRSIYFPTFLVNFPRRVYLEGEYGKIDSYYRKVLSDVLNGLKNPLSIDKHIIERVEQYRKSGQIFSSSLRSSKEGRQIDATVQALAAELNFVIFGAWGEIFEKPVINRKIVIEWHIDEDKDNHIYLEFYIIAGDYRFYISERSLGFRWFFSFLLFTQFQRSRNDGRKLVFLFDEPASHLHPKAQERLLKSFLKIAEPNHIIIYSTHSHYMINPLWLEQAYVIKNSASDDSKDDTGISQIDSKVIVTAEQYKSYISSNPSKTTYYQPIMDVIDYSPGGLDISSPVVVLEGKFDYYPFRYLLEKIGGENDFRVIPSVGAGGLSALVGILRAWCVKFIIILDDDDAGRKERGKYRNDLMLGENQVATLYDLNDKLSDCEFEDIFQDDVKHACISAGFSNGGRVKKSQYYSYFQYLQSGLTTAPEFPDTISIFEELVTEISSRLAAQ